MKLNILIKTAFIGTIIINSAIGIISHNKKENESQSINWDNVAQNANLDQDNKTANLTGAQKEQYYQLLNENINNFKEKNYSIQDIHNYAVNLQKQHPEAKTNSLVAANKNVDLPKLTSIQHNTLSSSNPSNYLGASNASDNDYYQKTLKNVKGLLKQVSDIRIAAITCAAVSAAAAVTFFAMAFFDFGATVPNAIACSVLAVGMSALAIGLFAWEGTAAAQVSKMTEYDWTTNALNITFSITGALIGVIVVAYAITLATEWAFPDPVLPLIASFPVALIAIATIIASAVTSYIADKNLNPPTPWVPTNPVDPTPITPDTPWTPLGPSTPITPDTPWTPLGPSTPITPDTPWTPLGPSTPITPDTPWTPIDPSTPVTPWTPLGPSTPITPDTPTPDTPNNKPTPQFNFITFEIIGAAAIILITLAIAITIFLMINYRKKSTK